MNAPQKTAAIALSLSLLAGCGLLDSFASSREEPAAKPEIRSVRVEPVIMRQIEEPIHITAEVTSSVQVDLEPLLSGTVETLFKKLGDPVAEGEIIAKLISEEAQYAYEQSKAAVEQAKMSLQTARQELAASRQEMSAEIRKMELHLQEMTRQHNKLRNDYDSGQAAKEEVDRSAAELETYRQDLQLARNRLQALNRSERIADLENRLADAQLAFEQQTEALAQLEIRAAVSGVITQLSLIEGMNVRAGVAVGRIEQVDPVRIVAYLNEEGAQYVRGKDRLRFVRPGGEAEPEEAAVTYLSAVPDPERSQYVLELTVPNADGKLKPGMKAAVELSEEAELTALAVPQYGVIDEGGRRYVFVLDGDVTEKREVKIGRTTPSYYEVLSGVQEGERIVVTGVNSLTDGERVLVLQSNTEGNAQ